MVGETSGEPIDEADRLVGGAEQKRSRIRRHRPVVETTHNLTARDRCKFKRIQATICRHRGDPSSRSRKTTFSDSKPRCTYKREKSGPGWVVSEAAERPGVPANFDAPQAAPVGIGLIAELKKDEYVIK